VNFKGGIKMFNNFEKIKETYKVTSILDTINGIDIIAVAKHDLEWLIEEVESLHDWIEVQEEAIKHLRFQLESSNNKNKELEDVLIKTHQKSTERIIELEKDIQFFKNRQEINKIITQELVELNDPRIVNIFTKTRIVQF
jgi:hypothetical protein